MAGYFEYLEKGEFYIKSDKDKKGKNIESKLIKENVDSIIENDIDLSKIIECIKDKNDFCYQEYLNDKLSLGMSRNKGYNNFDKIIFNQENSEKLDVINKVFNDILRNELLRIQNSDDYEDKDFLISVIFEMYCSSLRIHDGILYELIELSKYEPELASQITAYKYAY